LRRIRLTALLGAHQGRQSIGPLAEVDRTRRDYHPRAGARSNHRKPLSASITAAIIPASAPLAIFTATPSISSSMAVAACRVAPELEKRQVPVERSVRSVLAQTFRRPALPLTAPICGPPTADASSCARRKSATDPTHGDAPQHSPPHAQGGCETPLLRCKSRRTRDHPHQIPCNMQPPEKMIYNPLSSPRLDGYQFTPIANAFWSATNCVVRAMRAWTRRSSAANCSFSAARATSAEDRPTRQDCWTRSLL